MWHDSSLVLGVWFQTTISHDTFVFFLCSKIARDYKKWIRSTRFSPDNNVLALASGDASVYLYDVEDFTSIGCSGRPVTRITRINCSSDSKWLHCNSGKPQTAPIKVILVVILRLPGTDHTSLFLLFS